MNRNSFSSPPLLSFTASEFWELLLAVSDQDATAQSNFMFLFFLKGVLAIYWNKRKIARVRQSCCWNLLQLTTIFFYYLSAFKCTPAIALTCHCHVPQQRGHYLLWMYETTCLYSVGLEHWYIQDYKRDHQLQKSYVWEYYSLLYSFFSFTVVSLLFSLKILLVLAQKMPFCSLFILVLAWRNCTMSATNLVCCIANIFNWVLHGKVYWSLINGELKEWPTLRPRLKDIMCYNSTYSCSPIYPEWQFPVLCANYQIMHFE